MKTEVKNSKKKLLAASIAGLVAVVGSIATLPATAHAEEVPCYGVNKCKGTGECGGKGHSCHGQNACKGKGWVKMDSKECLAMEGGSLSPAE